MDKNSISLSVNGTKVTPAITGTAADYTVTYDPALNFSYGTRITVVVSAKDQAGNAMVPVSYSFTTGQAPDIRPEAPKGVSVKLVNPNG